MSNFLDLRELSVELNELREDKVSGDEIDEERLKALESLSADLGGDLASAADSEPSLIPEHEWVTHCQQTAEDVGYMSHLDNNPLANHIDWDGWAEAMKADYSEIEFDGETYLRRD